LTGAVSGGGLERIVAGHEVDAKKKLFGPHTCLDPRLDRRPAKQKATLPRLKGPAKNYGVGRGKENVSAAG
jgi:hypothetical protein